MDLNTLSTLPPQVLAAYLRDPQQSILSNMVKEGTDTSPVKSPWEGLARALKAGVGAYAGGQLRNQYENQAQGISDERNKALALALGKPAQTQNYDDGTTINWNPQAPNYAAAATGLSGANQDLGDKLFGAASAERAQQAGFNQQKSLQDAGFQQAKEMSGEQLANAEKLKSFEFQMDPMNQMLAQYLKGGSQPAVPPDGAASGLTPATPPGGMSYPSPSGPAPFGPGASAIPSAGIPQMNASSLAQPPQGANSTPPTQLPSPPPSGAPPSPTVGQITQPQTAPTVGQVTTGASLPGIILAIHLGLKDQQIGPNGQPMPIPGTTKIDQGKVLTIGPDGKPTEIIPPNPQAKAAFEAKLADIADKLDKLHKIGGTVEEGSGIKNWLNNQATRAAASKEGVQVLPEWAGGAHLPSGQSLLQGTPAQTLRDDIQANVKQALPIYMQAMGITPGMERAQQAQQMLLEALGGDVGQSRQHFLDNLSNLSKQAGTGDLATRIQTQRSPTGAARVNVMSPDGKPYTIDQGELAQALQNGWKQQ